MNENIFPADALDCVVTVAHKPLGDQGEDAFAFDFTRGSLHAQAVFDGCGGAGAWRYPEFFDRTGAFVSAQTLARAFLDWVPGLDSAACDDSPALAESFRAMAEETLLDLKGRARPWRCRGRW